MANFCSTCTYLKVDGDTKNGAFWCESKKDWIYANEVECYYYCTAYSRPSRVADKAKQYSIDSQKSGGCYITTMLCKILSMNDNNFYLNMLRNFRNTHLQNNREGLKILIEYDLIGPKISQMLEQDPDQFHIAYTLFNNYIIPTCQYINEKKYNEAISKYIEMTNKLIVYYNLNKDLDIKVEEYEANQCGHGIIRKKLSYI